MGLYSRRENVGFFNFSTLPPPCFSFRHHHGICLLGAHWFCWLQAGRVSGFPRVPRENDKKQLLSLNETTTRRALFEQSEFASLGLSLATVFSLRVSFSFPHFLFLCFATKRIVGGGWRAKRELLPVKPFNADNQAEKEN